MGLFDKLFKPKQIKAANSMSDKFETFSHRSSFFRNFRGSINEIELTSSIVHSKAKHTAKLSLSIQGEHFKKLDHILKYKPNQFQSTYDFLYRLRLLYEIDTYVFIIPIYDKDGLVVEGFFPLKSQNVTLMEFNNEVWLRYSFSNGDVAAIRYDEVGVLSKMNYENEFIGDGNYVLDGTLSLLSLENQGMQDAIKQSAKIEFIAIVEGNVRDEDLIKERKKFSEMNLSSDNNTRVMMFGNKFREVKQIEHKPYVPDEKKMNFIKNNMFSYFGINEEILQNNFDENTWNAFYEGEIEPFAIQLSLALTNMIFNDEEKAAGSLVHVSANRLQYASNATKLEVSKSLFDRGIFGTHDIAEIWQMPKEGENTFYIRKEYAEMERVGDTVTQVEKDKAVKEEINKKEDLNDDIKG